MKWNSAHWRRKVNELEKFIAPLVADMGRSERRESAALYIQGLLMPGQRKSIEPIAHRLRVDSQTAAAVSQRQPLAGGTGLASHPP